MLRILDRYILKEIFPSLLMGIGVFTFVILLNEILRLARILISQSVAASDALAILLNLLPSVLCITIPMGFLLGILVALGRLAADSEITAMRASGISLYRLLTPMAIAAGFAWMLTSYFIIYVLPDSNQRVRQLLVQVMTSQAGTEVRPRVFYDKLFPNVMFLVLDIPTGADYWQDVILADLGSPDSPRLTLAEKGRLLVDSKDRTVTFYLENAELHQVSYRKPNDYQRQMSAEIFFPLPSDTFFPPEDINVPRGAREMTLSQLYRSHVDTAMPVYLTEIHKKFAIPFACIVFGVLGLALGIHNRRDGRSWGFVVSIAVIFVYYVVIDIGENLAINGRLSPMLGMWTANIILGIAAIALLIRSASEAQGGLPSIGSVVDFFRSRLSGSRSAPAKSASTGLSKTVIVLRVPRVSIRFPNTLDRYVAREFTRYFFLILAALIAVYMLGLVIDILGDAFENNIKGAVVLRYLAAAQPQILFHMLPLASLMATLVAFAIFTKTSELTAAKAGGVSLYRIAFPVMLVGAAVSVGCFGLQEYLLPYANRRAAELRDEIKKNPVQTHNILDRKWMMGQGQQIYNYAYYDSVRRRFSGLAVYRYESEPFGVAERLYAQEADWIPERGGWVFRNGWSRNFETGSKHETFEERVVRDMEPPSYFIKEEKRSDQMTYLELVSYIRDMKRAGFDVVPLEVARQAKFSFPLAAMVTVLISVPFSFTPGKKGALYGLGIAIAIGLSYYVATRMFAFMGDTGMLPPFMAAWAPNVLFSVAALWGLFNVRT